MLTFFIAFPLSIHKLNRRPKRMPVIFKVLALPFEGALQLLENAPLHQAFAWH